MSNWIVFDERGWITYNLFDKETDINYVLLKLCVKVTGLYGSASVKFKWHFVFVEQT